MVELNPLALWQRLLALPNESRTKTLAVAFLVSALSALIVSGAAVTLRPFQVANHAAEREARLAATLAALPGMEEVLRASAADAIESLIVDLRSGEVVDGVDAAANFDVRAAADPGTALSAEADIAGIGRRPNLVRIHLVKTNGGPELVILPVYAVGYQSTIRAYLALEEDLNTVAALTVVEQKETPGLGSRIEDPAWQALWPGKRIADEQGQVRLSVVRGGATSVYEVDGISGATRTSNAVGNMVRFWLGEDGYGPVLRRLREGEL